MVSYDLKETSWVFLSQPPGGSSELCPIGNGLFQPYRSNYCTWRAGREARNN